MWQLAPLDQLKVEGYKKKHAVGLLPPKKNAKKDEKRHYKQN